jgi:hypothetical protein
VPVADCVIGDRERRVAFGRSCVVPQRQEDSVAVFEPESTGIANRVVIDRTTEVSSYSRTATGVPICNTIVLPLAPVKLLLETLKVIPAKFASFTRSRR